MADELVAVELVAVELVAVELVETPDYLFSMTPPQPLPRIEGGASVLIIS